MSGIVAPRISRFWPFEHLGTASNHGTKLGTQRMKTPFWLGLTCVVLGLLAFLVPIPHTEKQTFQTGSISMGISRTQQQRLPPAVGAILIVGGLALMIAGSRERARR